MTTLRTALPANLEALFAKLPAHRRPLPPGWAAELLDLVRSAGVRKPTAAAPEDLTAARAAIERAFNSATHICWHRPKEWNS